MLLALVCLRKSSVFTHCFMLGAEADGQVGTVLVGLDPGVDPNYLVRARVLSIAA